MTFRWNSVQELVALQERMNRLFEELLYSREFPEGPHAPAGAWTPVADVWENVSDVVFRIEIPGVSLDDVRLDLEGRRLRLSGVRRPAEAAHRFSRMERVYGEFDRVFEIPDDVDREGIAATLENGILTVTVPREGSVARPGGSR